MPGQTTEAAATTTSSDTGSKRRGGTNDVGVITVKYRAISLTSFSPSANTDTAFAVLNELKSNPMFDADETQFDGNVGSEEPPGTFTFSVVVKMKKPLKL